MNKFKTAQLKSSRIEMNKNTNIDNAAWISFKREKPNDRNSFCCWSRFTNELSHESNVWQESDKEETQKNAENMKNCGLQPKDD